MVYDAVVLHVRNFGMFVELQELQIQGLVPIAAIAESFVRFDHASESLRAGKSVFQRGDRVRVRVGRVDFDKRQVDFVLDDSSAVPKRVSASGGRTGKAMRKPAVQRGKTKSRHKRRR